MTITKRIIILIVVFSLFLLASCNYSIFDFANHYNDPNGNSGNATSNTNSTPAQNTSNPSTPSRDGNSASSAIDIAVNTPVTGALTSSKDKDYYSFKLDKKGIVIFEMQIPFNDGEYSFSRDWELTLFEESGSTVELMNHTFSDRHSGDFSSGNMDRQESPLIGLNPGTYCVRIVPGDYSSASYILTVKYTETGSCEAEPNEKANQASPLLLNVPYTGALQSRSDCDFYAFSVEAKGTVVFEIQIPFNNGEYSFSRDWELEVFTGDGTNVTLMRHEFNDRSAGDFSSGDMDRQESPLIGLDVGKYYVSIHPGDHSSAKYILTAKYTATDYCEAEPNDKANQASPLAINTPHIGALQSTNDKDFYVLTMDKTGNVAFELQIPFNNGKYSFSRDWELTVFAGDGTNKELMNHTFSDRSSGDFSSGNLDRQETKTITLEKGVYYIRIKAGDHSSASYILTVLPR